jgi:hypothetical protein
MRLPLVLLLLAASLHAAPPPKIEEADRPIVEAFLGHAQSELATLTPEHFANGKMPETLCWVELPKMSMALTAYELTGDRAWLSTFAKAARNLLAAKSKGPDGYEGWYGVPIEMLRDPAKPDAVVSEIQTDFRAAGVFARFAELTESDPVAREEFAADRDALIALARDHLIRKWDSSFVDLGDRGAVYRWNVAYKPVFSEITLAQEKAALMIDGLLGMARVTGDPAYTEKAAKLGLWFKHCLEYDGTAYRWNRWNPAGAWDVNPENPAKWRSWIGAEPKAIWHIASVGSAVQLYEHGLVFKREDIERFARTQETVCWNGDLEQPQFFRLDGKPSENGEWFVAPSLAPFNARLAMLLYEGKARDIRLSKTGSPWHGGVLAGDWLWGKYLRLPAGEKPVHAQVGEAFLAKASPELRAALAYTPKPPGHLTPPVPSPEALASLK